MTMLTIDQALALANVLNAGKTPPPGHCTENHGHAIVVADRGNVWVGEVSTSPDWCYIKSARVIRLWGTTKGLNQLAIEGPQSGTKLDAASDLRVNMKALIAIIPTKDVWK